MKKLLTFFLSAPAFLFAQNAENVTEKGMHFEHTTFAEILAKAKKENKMVFIDAYTTWCGPCKWMVKNVFPTDTAGEFYNKNFINAKIDMEKGEGLEIAKNYSVTCYPTYLYLDNNGQLMHRVSSSMFAAKFVELGKDAMDPAKQFITYKTKYDAGKATADETGQYIAMRRATCMSAKEETAKYFSTQKEGDLTSQNNWKILSDGRRDISVDSREFRYLIDHQEEYTKLYTSKTVDDVIKSVYSMALYNHAKNKDTDGYKKQKEEIISRKFSFGEEMVLNSDMYLYKSTKDWTNYTLTATQYIEKFKMDDDNALNNIAWDIYLNVEDKEILTKAEKWIKHSVELKPGYHNSDTYAAVLYKLGKKAEAKILAEKAIELGKKSGVDYKLTEELLVKINALK